MHRGPSRRGGELLARGAGVGAWGVASWVGRGAVAALLGGQLACGALDRVQTCGEIPAGGCPLGRGGTCDDVLCEGLYDCVDGAWTLAEDCDRVVGQGGQGAGGGAGSGGGCDGHVVDRSDEAQGCEPDLQEPDCPAAVAETCAPCSTGCVDFWLCRTEGWAAVGYCDELGVFIPEATR